VGGGFGDLSVVTIKNVDNRRLVLVIKIDLFVLPVVAFFNVPVRHIGYHLGGVDIGTPIVVDIEDLKNIQGSARDVYLVSGSVLDLVNGVAYGHLGFGRIKKQVTDLKRQLFSCTEVTVLLPLFYIRKGQAQQRDDQKNFRKDVHKLMNRSFTTTIQNLYQ